MNKCIVRNYYFSNWEHLSCIKAYKSHLSLLSESSTRVTPTTDRKLRKEVVGKKWLKSAGQVWWGRKAEWDERALGSSTRGGSGTCGREPKTPGGGDW